jgi:hypothetical protein
MGGRRGGQRNEWTVALRVGFININDMYNNDGGQGGSRVCEVHEVININDMYNNDGGQGGARVCEAHEVK